MNQPLISVIIPTYNRPTFLCELLEALFRQTYKHLQIIVVNDAGTNVDFILGLYPELNIQVIHMPHNSQHVKARNRGLQEATGEYVMLCDDDDLLLPEHIATMLTAISDCDLVYSDVEIFDYQVEGTTRIASSRFLFAYEHDLTAMRTFSTFVSSGCLYRRSLHEIIGPFDTEVYHYWDWDFFLSVSSIGKVKRVPVASALYAFSPQGDNMSGDLGAMRPYLDKLSAKHDLGELPTANFFTLLETPEVLSRKAESTILWDGQPIRSRYRL